MSHFEALPRDIHLCIFEHLDYGSALALAATNHFLRSSRPVDSLNSNTKTLYLVFAETFTQNTDSFACHFCFRILLKSAFADQQVKDTFVRKGINQLARFCFNCGVSKQLFRVGECVTKNNIELGFCTSCQRIQQRKWCTKCELCEQCMKDGGYCDTMRRGRCPKCRKKGYFGRRAEVAEAATAIRQWFGLE